MELTTFKSGSAQPQKADPLAGQRETGLAEPVQQLTDPLADRRDTELTEPGRQSADALTGRCEATLTEPAWQTNHSLCLRPHHLLCTMAWVGKGYDDAFTAHMDEIVHRLRTEARTPVELVFCTDELCAACPNMQGPDLCSTNEKVKALDRKTAACFHLEPRTYFYQELIREICRTADPRRIEQICGDCSWYRITNCRELILKYELP